MEKLITVEVTEKEAIQIQALLELYIREQMGKLDKYTSNYEDLQRIDYYTNLQKKFTV